MKVGRGLFGLMSKSNRKCTFRRYSPFLYVFVLVVLGSTLILTGCGELSLNQLLENQEPGELGISPKTATLPAESTITITGKGGFKPYSYENKTGKGTLDATTGVYKAPKEVDITGNSEEIEIEVTDNFGRKASGSFTVFKSLSLSLAESIIPKDTSAILNTSGGVPDYDISIDGVLATADHPSGDWTTPVFTTVGVYLLEVVDSLGNSAQSPLTVIDGDLMIDVAKNWVVTGGSLSVTAINPVGDHTFSATEGGFADPTDSPTDFNAPGSETVVTITLVDSSIPTREATVEVHVLASVPDPLSFPSTISLEPWEKTDWLIVTGGVPPYEFTFDGDGLLDPLLADRLKYRAPDYETTEYLWVEDAVGEMRKLTIYIDD